MEEQALFRPLAEPLRRKRSAAAMYIAPESGVPTAEAEAMMDRKLRRCDVISPFCSTSTSRSSESASRKRKIGEDERNREGRRSAVLHDHLRCGAGEEATKMEKRLRLQVGGESSATAVSCRQKRSRDSKGVQDEDQEERSREPKRRQSMAHAEGDTASRKRRTREEDEELAQATSTTTSTRADHEGHPSGRRKRVRESSAEVDPLFNTWNYWKVPLETELEELDDDSDEDGTGMRLT